MLDIVDPLTEEPIANNELLAGRCVLVRPLMLDWGYDFDQEQTHMEVTSEKSANPDMNEEFVVSATVPFTVQQDESVDSAGIVTVDESEEVEALMDGKDGIQHDPLEALTPKEFVQLRMPVLTSLQAVTSMTKPQMGANIRLKGLEVQHDLWADDEIRWHVGKILEQAGNPTKVCLDPLIATAVVSSGNAGLIYQWIRSQKVNPSMIVTAVLHDGHWVPIVWTWTSECTTAHSWDVQRQVPNFNVLHDAIAKAVGSRTYLTHIMHRNFAPYHLCGVCAVRWIDHMVSGKMLPTSIEDAEHLQSVGKDMFVVSLQSMEQVQRPWAWGAGLDANAVVRFKELLVQHGVPLTQVDTRVMLATQAIGVANLQKAIVSTSPWRSIKALANQVRPPMQLVMPAELEESLKTKASSGTIAAKKKGKGNDKSKPLPKLPPPLDPAKLVTDATSFVSSEGKQLARVSVSSLGPATEGVAVATILEVDQFLRNGAVVSPEALGIFVINTQDLQCLTDLQWSQCRIAMKCATNGEPMLVQGVLVQLGEKMVIQAKQKHALEVGDVQASCAKITIYRDVFTHDWQEFLKAPVRFVLNALAPLQQCDQTEGCSCPKWQRDKNSSVRDPVFDVWRRQWMNLSFHQTTPQSADAFSVNVRFDKKVETQVFSLSGTGGLFVEPRSLDGKSPVDDYNVIWLPRVTMPEVQHLRQTMPTICGIVRMGSRLGVRVATADAAQVAKELRPDTIALNGGQKVEYEVGPIPFGMDRAALASMCSNWGWKIKPVNPVRSVGEGLGMIWIVQAVTEPPSNVLCTKQGDVVVNKAQGKPVAQQIPMAPVASSKTVELCSVAEKPGEGKVDPLVRNDPWAKSVDP